MYREFTAWDDTELLKSGERWLMLLFLCLFALLLISWLLSIMDTRRRGWRTRMREERN